MSDRNQTIAIPLAKGLNLKSDVRAMDPPGMAICRDVQFDEVQGAQTRYPFSSGGQLLNNTIVGGGTLSNCRRFFDNGGELLCFTDTHLYAWSGRDLAWAQKAEHLAVSVAEQTVMATNDDQQVCDRAELANTVVYTWVGLVSGGTNVYIAAVDKITGAIILRPALADGNAIGGSAPRLVALQTKIMLFWWRSSDVKIVCIALDPASVRPQVPTVVSSATNIGFYDVAAVPGADTCVLAVTRNPDTSYDFIKITTALAISTATKARTADGPVAIAVDPTHLQAQVIRSSTTSLLGDLLTISTGADVNTSTAIGTTSATTHGRIAAAFRSVQSGGFYRCYVFWDADESVNSGAPWTSSSNWVDTNNAHGAAANFIRFLSPASRAFDYNGSVYLWMEFSGLSLASGSVFSAALQNTYMLYRDDGTLVSKATQNNAAGFPATALKINLPNVALVSGTTQFAWIGSFRRIISNAVYEARVPRDIVFTFDSNDARRCARLGRTCYISGGLVSQYDGTNIYEVGYLVFPWALSSTLFGAGAIADGTYAYKSTWRMNNAQGEVDRSTTANVAVKVLSGGGGETIQSFIPLYTSRKLSVPLAIEIWRTQKNPTIDSDFYLDSGIDPSVLTGDNCYVVNDPTQANQTLKDNLADAALAVLQTNPENGSVLEYLPPPAATIIAASATRLFLSGIPGQPNTVVYSRQRQENEVASFNDALSIDIPPEGGDITALGFINECLVVFRENAVYFAPSGFDGGFDNTGGGSNFGPVQRVPGKLGAVNQESIALADAGLFFKSSQGYAILNRGFTVDEVGLPVEDFKSEALLAVDVMPNQRQIRCLSASRMLVYDTLIREWSEWTVANAVHSTTWNNGHVYMTLTQPRQQDTSYAALTYGLDVELGWFKTNGLQGFGRVRRIGLLGEFRTACIVRTRIAYDYAYDGSGNPVWVDDFPWTATPTTVGSGLQMRHGVQRGRCEAIKVRFTLYEMPQSASQDIGVSAFGLAAGIGTAITCKASGTAGDGILVTIVDDSAGAVTISETGTPTTGGTLTIHIKHGTSTSAAVEAALAASTLVTVTHADTTPGRSYAADNTYTSLALVGGTDLYDNGPSGEAVKLTGMSLEYAPKPGINKRLSASQKA